MFKFKQSYSENDSPFLKVGQNPEKIVTSSPLEDKKERKIQHKEKDQIGKRLSLRVEEVVSEKKDVFS